MKYVLAIDSFKGCLTSREAAAAAAAGIMRIHPDADVRALNVSDGGEGMLSAYTEALGGRRVSVTVHDALMRPVTASYGISGGTAVIESAEACGLTLIEPSERNAVEATSYGVGELVNDAERRGCRRFIVGLGGTACSDGGNGMFNALLDALPGSDRMLQFRRKFSGCEFIIASDVDNPLNGQRGAARVFAPQKGATPAEVTLIEERLRLLSAEMARLFSTDRSAEPGAGAGGGLGYAFLQCLNARYQSGAELILDLLRFDYLVAGATLVVTGEGSADSQTLMGKLPYVVMRRAAAQGVPTLTVSGRVADRRILTDAGFTDAVCINAPGTPLNVAMNPSTARHNIEDTVAQWIGRQ